MFDEFQDIHSGKIREVPLIQAHKGLRLTCPLLSAFTDRGLVPILDHFPLARCAC